MKFIALLLFVLTYQMPLFAQSNEHACTKQCSIGGFENIKCVKCLGKDENLKIPEGKETAFYALCTDACSQSGGGANPKCTNCMNKYPGVYKAPQPIDEGSAQYKCKRGKNGVMECHKKTPELTDCQKGDDGKTISCPDGEYVKSSSVVDSVRSIEDKIKQQEKKSSPASRATSKQ